MPLKENIMFKVLKICGFATLLCATLLQTAVAQDKFTTAAEVRPILTATKKNWLAVRNYDGRDLLYFTQLLSWRCGLEAIQYGINSDIPVMPWAFTPCNDTQSSPNTIPNTQEIYASFAPNSIYFVTVKITYDDGTTDQVTFKRKEIEIN